MADEEVDTLKVEKNPADPGEEADAIPTDKRVDVPEPDQPAVRSRLPDDYVTLVLAMPRETPVDTEDLSFITDLAKLMNRSEDWIEERKRRYLERAALRKRINEQFAQFQDSMRDQWCTKGYVEADCDFDWEAMVEKFNRELWNEYNPPK